MDKRISFRLNPKTDQVERYVERRFGAHWSGVSSVPMGTLAEFQDRYPDTGVEGVSQGASQEPKAESLETLLRRATPEQLEELGYLRVYEGDEGDQPDVDEDGFTFDDDI